MQHLAHLAETMPGGPESCPGMKAPTAMEAAWGQIPLIEKRCPDGGSEEIGRMGEPAASPQPQMTACSCEDEGTAPNVGSESGGGCAHPQEGAAGFLSPGQAGTGESVHQHGPAETAPSADGYAGCRAMPSEPRYFAPGAPPQGYQKPPGHPYNTGPSAGPWAHHTGQQQTPGPNPFGCHHGPGHGPGSPKHEAHQYGQLVSLVNDLANGNADASRVMAFLGTLDTQFWKGALVGVGATLLMTNGSVKNALAGAFSGVLGVFGKEETDRKTE